MKAYICDACGAVIDDPHEAEMKEFSLLVEENGGALLPFVSTKRVKIHLCGECYHGLHLIAEDVIRREAEECAEI